MAETCPGLGHYRAYIDASHMVALQIPMPAHVEEHAFTRLIRRGGDFDSIIGTQGHLRLGSDQSTDVAKRQSNESIFIDLG